MAEVFACQVEVLDGSTVSIDVNVSFSKLYSIVKAHTSLITVCHTHVLIVGTHTACAVSIH